MRFYRPLLILPLALLILARATLAVFRRGRMTTVVPTLCGLLFVVHSNLQPSTPAQEPSVHEKAQAQEEAYPPPLELYEAETIAFSAPPPMGFSSGIKCDLNSNIYLVYTEAPGFGSEPIYPDTPLPPVRKLALSSQTVVSYAIQSLAGYELVRREDFAVEPRGTVYALLEAYERKPDFRSGKVVILDESSATDAQAYHPRPKEELPQRLIAKFKDDGAIDSFVKLQPFAGQNFGSLRFAVYADGNFLVTGVLNSEAVPFDEKPFTAIFNRAGVLVQELTWSRDVCPEPTAPAPEPRSRKGSEQAADTPEPRQGEGQSLRRKYQECVNAVGGSLMVGAPDGNIYLMRASNPARIYAVSPIGEVVQEWSVKPPRSDVYPVEMSLAGQNRLLLEFVHAWTPKDAKPHMVLALLDLGTGQVTATYQLPPGRGNLMPACMTPRDEFLTLGTTEDRKLKVVKFVAR